MSDTVAEKPPFNIPEFSPEALSNPPKQMTRGRVGDIPVEVHVLIGRARVSVSQLMAAKEGVLFKLDRRFGDPVELQVNGKTIGYGEIVSDDRDNLVGIKMTSVDAVY
jgi:flagellar motor switch protein FliN/FliY